MKIITVDSYLKMSRMAANIISAQVIIKSDSVLGLATGSTPVGIYKQLIEWYNKGDIDFSNVVSYNLDEYLGLPASDKNSYRHFMDSNLFNSINIKKENTYVPNGCADDILSECKNYDDMIKKSGGIDLQLLGLGLDGHIGFNEPDTCFARDTHVVSLKESTIAANSRFFENKQQVPREAITTGMVSIMQAKKILLVANGENKNDIINKAFYGPITPEIPASILQLHPDITVIYSKH